MSALFCYRHYLPFGLAFVAPAADFFPAAGAAFFALGFVAIFFKFG